MIKHSRQHKTFTNVDKSIKTLNLAIEVFQEYLSDKTSSDPEKYYRAHEYLEESKTSFQEALNEISRLTESLLQFLTPEEMDVFLMRHYESQKLGKRKLSNIKARFIIDKIKDHMAEAETLDIKSKEKLYQLK
jgi:hypothetical protein